MDMEHKNAVKRLSPLNGKKGCKRHLSRTGAAGGAKHP